MSKQRLVMGAAEEKNSVKITKHQKQGISAEKAMNILKKNGVSVGEKQAKQILELLFILAKLEVDQYLKS